MIINGTKYEVISEKKFSDLNRTEITLRKPNGKRLYHVVRYEDGTLSSVA